jgi:hypothetical protein
LAEAAGDYGAIVRLFDVGGEVASELRERERNPALGLRSLRLTKPTQDPKQWPGFTVHTCLQGECEITSHARDKLEPTILKRGETVLWPAVFDKFEYFPRGDCWVIQSWARE